jgi:hypothetical protein
VGGLTSPRESAWPAFLDPDDATRCNETEEATNEEPSSQNLQFSLSDYRHEATEMHSIGDKRTLMK